MKFTHRASLLVTTALVVFGLLSACTQPTSYDLILRSGTIYDGSGDAPYVGDVALNGDTIAALGDLGNATAKAEIDVQGLAVAPGFVNMMSWANESLIEDGRSQSDIRQGVTLEIMGGSGRHPLRRRVDDAGRVSRVSRATRGFCQRGIVHRCRNTAQVRHWL